MTESPDERLQRRVEACRRRMALARQQQTRRWWLGFVLVSVPVLLLCYCLGMAWAWISR